MTQRSGTTTISERTRATIRAYRVADHSAGRRLWQELTEEHRALYPAVAEAGGDAGAGFEEYLARIDLAGVWVAEDPRDGVVGLAGLILRGRAGEVEPVVVAAHRRGEGIGRQLLGHVADQARERGMTSLTVSPAARNIAAIHCLHAAGYDALSAVQLTFDLTPRRREWRDGMAFQDLRFRY